MILTQTILISLLFSSRLNPCEKSGFYYRLNRALIIFFLILRHREGFAKKVVDDEQEKFMKIFNA
jgi:hypothetical protein